MPGHGQTIKVLQYNICGASCWDHATPNHGAPSQYPDVDFRGDVDTRCDKIANSLSAYNADFMSLNELCSVQLDDLISRTGYYGTMSVMDSSISTCNNYVAGSAAYGVGLLTRWKQSNVRSWQLPGVNASNGQHFYLNAVESGGITFANTHLINNDSSIRVVQVAYIKAILLAMRGPVVFAGDLNTPAGPNSSSQAFYEQFNETDYPENEFTAGITDAIPQGDSKIDYIFWSKPHFKITDGDSATYGVGSVSDHRLLRGSAIYQGSLKAGVGSPCRRGC